ncbi:MAG: alpha/beta hydrolase [Desulfobacterales bacterium]
MAEQKLLIPNRDGNLLHSIFFPAQKSDSGFKKHRIVILCHGFKGDKLEWGRFKVTATALNRAGYDALTFDFSGSGENKREPVLLSRQITDLEDVAEWALQKEYYHIGTIGLSFGGTTSLAAKIPARKTAVFWAPAMYPERIASGFERIVSKMLRAVPFFEVKRDSSGNFPPILVNSSFAKETFGLDADSYLRRFTIPSLIIQGDADTVVKPEFTKEAFLKMPQDGDHNYVEIKKAAHDFDGEHLSKFIGLTIDWLRKYL